ncbi:hypothetical protein [Mesobacillus subterraneus]|uniref:Uncharacterized protein n=1 Tax=Mesobacillus subterraneus TaxID=285983 RepID=A0A3R9EX61_9BACI|nr:hypothetical protein [Mesobacillus subterraneus]RSD25112.1 hypothetical protein EJA10_17745 [Mesobacillus subterraneus]
MPEFNLQQVPESCFEPVTIGGFVVTLVDIEPVDGGFRWIYRVDNVTPNSPALSNWVLAIEEPCLDFISDPRASEVFLTTDPAPTELFPVDFENPGRTPQPGCPEGSPCGAGIRLDGFAFIPDQGELGELQPGFSQLFAFTFNQPQIATTACASISAGGVTACGLICVPDCIVCPDACECPEDNNTFTCTATVPTSCFTIPEEVATEDVLFGFCIVDQEVVAPTEEDVCQAPAEVFVCGQTLICCCDVFPWTRTVTLDIQFNVPKTADCQTENLYECCFETITVEQTCFTCNIDDNPFPEEDLTCEDIEVIINSVVVNEAGTSADINYTVELPECEVPLEEPPVGTPPGNTCPPPAPAPRNTQPVNKTAINMPTVNSAKRRKR